MAEAVQQELEFPVESEFSGEFLGALSQKNKIGYGITVGEDDTVLELVRYDTNGTFVRSNGRWESIDPDAEEEENPTIFNQTWYEVAQSFTLYYDFQTNQRDKIQLNEITNFLVL